MKNLNGINVIAVHAHPDDEAIWTGGMLSDLAMRGANVLVVTCTLGEQGEVIGEPYANLVADKADQLGGFRIRELQKSLKTLGIRGTFLGGAGCWRDSGMAGDPANQHPRAFTNAGDEAVEQLKSIFLTHPPHLIITYGPDGGYGHPDHIKAHEITHRAVEQRNLVTPILWAVTDRRRFDEGVAVITAPTTAGWRMPQPNEIACVTSSDIEVRLSDAALAAKVQAMKAHATQLWIADGSINDTNPVAAFAPIIDPEKAPFVFALSNLITQPLLRFEHYQIGTVVNVSTRNTIEALVAGELEAGRSSNGAGDTTDGEAGADDHRGGAGS